MILNRHQKYKSCPIPFISEVPTHWDVEPNKKVFSPSHEFVGSEWGNTQLLSLSLQGVINRDIDSGVGKYPSDFGGYQFVQPNDLVLCLFDIDETPRTVGIASGRGMITSAYDIFRCNESSDPRFVYYYYLSVDSFKGLRPYYTGLRKVVRPSTFLSIPMCVPPKIEQTQIAAFLDHETAKIDALVAEQQRLIDLLQEKRQALISHAVTKGLDPTVPMKDSGVEWLGDVPAHWTISQFKQLIDIQNGADHKLIEADDGVPVIGSGGTFSFASEYLYDGESVLLGRKGTIDKPLYVRGKFWTVDTMYWTKIHPDAHGKFAYYVALSIPFGYYSTNTALPSMTKSALSSHPICFPDFLEQSSIADFLDHETKKIDALSSEAQKAMHLLQERRTALISAAVTGKIDVRNWQAKAQKEEVSA